MRTSPIAGNRMPAKAQIDYIPPLPIFQNETFLQIWTFFWTGFNGLLDVIIAFLSFFTLR